MRCAPRLFARRCHSHVGRSQAYQRALRSLPQRTPRQRLPNHTRWPNMPTPFISKDKIYSTQLHGVYEQHMDFSTSRPIRARRVDQLLVALMRPGPVVSLVLEPSTRFALVALGGFATADGPSATLLSFGIKSQIRSCLSSCSSFPLFYTSLVRLRLELLFSRPPFRFPIAL